MDWTFIIMISGFILAAAIGSLTIWKAGKLQEQYDELARNAQREIDRATQDVIYWKKKAIRYKKLAVDLGWKEMHEEKKQ